MEFAEQERKPEQTILPEYQSSSPKVSEEDSIPPGNGVDYSKVPAAFQGKYDLASMPTSPPERDQGQANMAAPTLIAGGLGGALPKPSPGLAETAAKGLKSAAPALKGAAKLGGKVFGGLGGIILEGVFAEPAGGEAELAWERRNAERMRQQQVLQSTKDHGGGKNAQHGKSEDRPSDVRRLEELDKQIESATGSEKKKLKAKKANLREEMAKRRKGENHSQKHKK